MRIRSQDRTSRFLNSKERTIGIDRNYLDFQVEEKNGMIRKEKEKENEEGMNSKESLMYSFVFSFEFLIDHIFPFTFLSAMYQREVCKYLEALD